MLDPLFFPYYGGTEKVVLEVGSIVELRSGEGGIITKRTAGGSPEEHGGEAVAGGPPAPPASAKTAKVAAKVSEVAVSTLRRMGSA